MFAAYTELSTWLAIVLGGVIGCLASWLLAYAIARVPFRMIGGHPGKQLWSVLFMIPVAFILALGGNLVFGLLLAFLWLTIAPSVGVRTVFPPAGKISNQQLFGGNAYFAVVALAAYMTVKALAG